MRKPGALMEFGAERVNSLFEAYRQEMMNAKVFNQRRAMQAVVHSPAPRFWVTEERAAIVISEILRGLPVLAKMRPAKQRMYAEITRRVQIRARANPSAHLSQLIREVIYQPAPEHYIEPHSALQLIHAENRRRHGKA